MRRGMKALALQVQEHMQRDPHAGDLFIFRGRRGDLAKILWHDGIGLSLYAKRRRWPACWRGSIGAIRAGPGGRRAPADEKNIRVGDHAATSQIMRSVIHSASWTPLATRLPEKMLP